MGKKSVKFNCQCRLLMAACGRLIWQPTPHPTWHMNSIHLSAPLSLLRAEARVGGGWYAVCVCVLKPRDRWPRMAVWPLCVRSVCEWAEWRDKAFPPSLGVSCGTFHLRHRVTHPHLLNITQFITDTKSEFLKWGTSYNQEVWCDLRQSLVHSAVYSGHDPSL